MTAKDVLQELEVEPFVPLQVHLADGERINIKYPPSAFVQKDALVVFHRLGPATQAILNYEVVPLCRVVGIKRRNA